MPKKLSELLDYTKPDYDPQLAAQTACDFTFHPKPDSRLNERQTTLMAQATCRVEDVGGNPIQIYDWNPTGPKIALLVHGIGGKCLDYVELIDILVTQGFRVIGFDAPSHGLSKEAPEGVDIGNFWLCIQKLKEIYGNHYDLAVGHSFGSSALTFQMRQNTIHADNLALFAPNAVFDSILLAFVKQIKAHQDLFPLICDFTAQRFANRIAREELWPANSTAENLSILASTNSLRNCLILHGTQDVMFSHEDSRRIVAACPSLACKLHIFESGHKSILNDVQTKSLFSDFCDKVRATPQGPGHLLPGYDSHTASSTQAPAPSDIDRTVSLFRKAAL